MTPQNIITAAEKNPTVMEEIGRLSKIIDDCSHTLLIMKRSNERYSRGIPQSAFDEVEKKKADATRERDGIEAMLGRYAEQNRADEIMLAKADAERLGLAMRKAEAEYTVALQKLHGLMFPNGSPKKS